MPPIKKSYVLIHFSKTEGGFHKRIEMLLGVLRKRAPVVRVSTLGGFIRFMLRRQPASVLLYISLMAPFAAIIRLMRPKVRIYYMIRGDEYTYVMNRRRRVRALVALSLQLFLKCLGCHFVFVCEDLRSLFESRLGLIRKASVLPNTIGRALPSSRQFDGRIALVGDFGTVKNTEFAITSLASGKFEVHLFGNKSLSTEWKRPWLHPHGVVPDMVAALHANATVVVLPYIDAGFPNVLVEALEAGCGVLVHRDFPFRLLPVSHKWRFDLKNHNGKCSSEENQLEEVLCRLLREQRDFKADNRELVELIESDWEDRVWEILE